MTIKFDIQTNAIEAKHFFDSLERSQLPFAISRAINRLAWDVRDAEQGKLDKYFEIRTNWLTKKGAMPVVASKKAQHPNIFAILGVKDDVAALAITGGEKKGSGMAVPFSDSGDDLSARSILNPGKETLGPNKWPGRVVKKAKTTKRRGRGLAPKPFYMKANNGKTVVALRSGVSRYPLKFLYGFQDVVDVPKSWPLVENTSAFVAQNYGPYLAQELDKAVRNIKL